MPKLAIVTSHPIQYYAPLFRRLAKDIELKVFYCHNPKPEEIGKDGFGKAFTWDVDLLAGYEYEFLENHSKKPSLSEYAGCDTPQIGEELREYEATHVVIFGWYLKSFKQALKYCKNNKIPVAARGDSQLDSQLSFWKKVVKKLYYPFFLSQYDAFLYVGKRNREYLKHYSVPDSKLIFSPHAVDQDFWKPSSKKEKSKTYTFIWVGKFTEKKRPWDALEAFNSAFKDNLKVQLHMVGIGKYLEEMKAKYKVSENIHFLGFKNQTELREEFNKADCLILSSDYGETWGLVVNEAMACGIPSIVSDACGCSDDMVDEGETGYVYPYSNLEVLKEKMQGAESSKDLNYQPFLQKKNEIYSFERNVQSFKKFLAFRPKS